jgi:hypothetical protein
VHEKPKLTLASLKNTYRGGLMNTSLPDEPTPSPARIPVAVSERHVHLAQSTIEQLFCDKYRLHEHSRVSQPTQFAALETVTLVGPRGRIARRARHTRSSHARRGRPRLCRIPPGGRWPRFRT